MERSGALFLREDRPDSRPRISCLFGHRELLAFPELREDQEVSTRWPRRWIAPERRAPFAPAKRAEIAFTLRNRRVVCATARRQTSHALSRMSAANAMIASRRMICSPPISLLARGINHDEPDRQRMLACCSQRSLVICSRILTDEIAGRELLRYYPPVQWTPASPGKRRAGGQRSFAATSSSRRSARPTAIRRCQRTRQVDPAAGHKHFPCPGSFCWGRRWLRMEATIATEPGSTSESPPHDDARMVQGITSRGHRFNCLAVTSASSLAEPCGIEQRPPNALPIPSRISSAVDVGATPPLWRHTLRRLAIIQSPPLLIMCRAAARTFVFLPRVRRAATIAFASLVVP